MKNNKLLFLTLLALLLAAGGCDKDKEKDVEEVEIVEVPEVPEAPDEPEDPEPPDAPPVNVGEFYKSFIGKWQEIGRGNESYSPPELTPTGYIIEFTPERDYKADAEFLYLGSGKTPNGYTYRYTFTGSDTLRLDYVDGLVLHIWPQVTYNIFKRLE
jgi:hypothetical protein